MKQLLWPIGWNSQHCHIAARGPQQTSHQIHQGRLARAIGTHQTGNPRRNGETHVIHAENLAIEFRDIVEHDCVLERVSHLNNPTSLPLPLGEGWGEGLAMSQSLFVVSSSEHPAKKEKGFFHRSSLRPSPRPSPKGRGRDSFDHLISSYFSRQQPEAKRADQKQHEPRRPQRRLTHDYLPNDSAIPKLFDVPRLANEGAEKS